MKATRSYQARRPFSCGKRGPQATGKKHADYAEKKKFKASVAEGDGELLICGHGNYRLKL